MNKESNKQKMKIDSFIIDERLDKLTQSLCRHFSGYKLCRKCPFYKDYDKCDSQLEQIETVMLDCLNKWEKNRE